MPLQFQVVLRAMYTGRAAADEDALDAALAWGAEEIAEQIAAALAASAAEMPPDGLRRRACALKKWKDHAAVAASYRRFLRALAEDPKLLDLAL